jgi:hypothetical protein
MICASDRLKAKSDDMFSLRAAFWFFEHARRLFSHIGNVTRQQVIAGCKILCGGASENHGIRCLFVARESDDETRTATLLK